MPRPSFYALTQICTALALVLVLFVWAVSELTR